MGEKIFFKIIKFGCQEVLFSLTEFLFWENTKTSNTSFTLPPSKVDTNKVFFLIKAETGVVFHNIRKKGTIFSIFVWNIPNIFKKYQELRTIPYGVVRAYKYVCKTDKHEYMHICMFTETYIFPPFPLLKLV